MPPGRYRYAGAFSDPRRTDFSSVFAASWNAGPVAAPTTGRRAGLIRCVVRDSRRQG